ncbi:hypothetical protein G6F57_022833 [Rhizopus arrhizus]|nr:hypothetical protein G6F57_022833 [Rhizopus arrhizus]
MIGAEAFVAFIVSGLGNIVVFAGAAPVARHRQALLGAPEQTVSAWNVAPASISPARISSYTLMTATSEVSLISTSA